LQKLFNIFIKLILPIMKKPVIALFIFFLLSGCSSVKNKQSSASENAYYSCIIKNFEIPLWNEEQDDIIKTTEPLDVCIEILPDPESVEEYLTEESGDLYNFITECGGGLIGLHTGELKKGLRCNKKNYSHSCTDSDTNSILYASPPNI